MNRPLSLGHRGRWALGLAVMACFAAPRAAKACELDGLSHGYGPMSALFAGAHRYQSLNGLDEEEAPVPEPAMDAPPPASAEAAPASGAPTAPRRSFVAWAKARPKPIDDASSAPATWTRPSNDTGTPPSSE